MDTLRKFIRDKHGKVAIWQTPNVPLLGWLLFMLATHLIHDPHLKAGVQFLSSAFLLTWAYLEIRSGVSGFRRLLGAVVMLNIAVNHLR